MAEQFEMTSETLAEKEAGPLEFEVFGAKTLSIEADGDAVLGCRLEVGGRERDIERGRTSWVDRDVLLLGDGPQRAQLEGRQDLRVLGAVGQVLDWLPACDALLLSSE